MSFRRNPHIVMSSSLFPRLSGRDDVKFLKLLNGIHHRDDVKSAEGESS